MVPALKITCKSKTKLIDHYVKSLGAYHFGGHLMVIDIIAAKKLVDRYFKPASTPRSW